MIQFLFKIAINRAIKIEIIVNIKFNKAKLFKVFYGFPRKQNAEKNLLKVKIYARREVDVDDGGGYICLYDSSKWFRARAQTHKTENFMDLLLLGFFSSFY